MDDIIIIFKIKKIVKDKNYLYFKSYTNKKN